MSQKPTKITITIDTEFSIAGHFDNPEKYKPLSTPVVTCPVDGQEQGLGFMLALFAKFDIKASFFVECANYFYFGDQPMQSLVQRIVDAGQDIQLHVHPVWLSFIQDSKLGSFPRNDDCAQRSFDDLFKAFKLCVEVFERWVGHKPLALRTGSLWADKNVYQVMNALGIPMASNIGLGVFKPKEDELQLVSGRRKVANVMEVPILTYQDVNILGKKHQKSIQITSCSWPEMKHILWKCRKLGIDNVVILTHPFEYIKKADFQYHKVTKNRVNQQRLTKLCAFITEHDQDFTSATFTSEQKEWQSVEHEQIKFAIPNRFAIGRKLHNKLNDTIWRY
ncbi:polysaccharide deacetylase [Candidatus Colwellia aromaticivorans]|uniref:polysaccharide deacetylase n=1 Tax=Candidatus Colwellia aromaticivorans TaxID=2267621 RepID=UPI000DF292BF|nr:polysaccharide deacetylase [Candidatus Colwellia aromaticivorans]